MATIQLHEDLQRGHRVKQGSDRSFGLVFAVVFAVVGLWPLFAGSVRWWAIAVALVLVLLAVLRPMALALPNKLWLRFGLLLHRVVSPIVILGLYGLAIVPMGFFLKVARKDLLRLRWDSAAKTYWIRRTETTGSMQNQF